MNRQAFSYLAVGLVVGSLLTTVAFVGLLRDRALHPQGARRVLKLAHVQDQSHPVHAAMEFMARRAAELSGGALEIQVLPNGQLGSESECIEQVQRGALAMTKTSTAAMEGFVPEMAVFSVPYLFRDEEHYWRVLNGPIGAGLLSAGERLGLRGLCYYDAGSRSFYTLKKPILTPADVKGLKIRVMQSRMSMDMISTLQGAPTPISFGELYTALQQGMVDGAENNSPSFLASRHYEVARFFSLDEHSRVPDIVVFSQAIWARLDIREQEWLTKAATESVGFQRDLWRKKTQETLEKLGAAGVTIVHPDKAAFVDAVSPLMKSLAETPVGDMAGRIKETR